MAGRLEELLEKAANEQSRLKSLEIVLQDRESQIRIQNEHVEKLASKIHELNRDLDDARLRQSNLQEESVKERREQARRIQDMEREIFHQGMGEYTFQESVRCSMEIWL